MFTGVIVEAETPSKQRNSEGEKKNETGGSCFLLLFYVGFLVCGLGGLLEAFWSRKWEKEKGFMVAVGHCLDAVVWWLSCWVGNCLESVFYGCFGGGFGDDQWWQRADGARKKVTVFGRCLVGKGKGSFGVSFGVESGGG